MAGETTVLHLPFAGGLDELIAKEYLDASSRQSYILNGDFVKTGTISKRNGLEHISTNILPGGSLGALTSGIRVAGWSRSSLSLLSREGLYTYTSAPVGGEAEGGLVGVGSLPNVGVLRRPLITGTNNGLDLPTICDLEYSGHTLRLTFFRDPVDIYARVHDLESGNTVLPAVLVAENGGGFSYVVSAFGLANAPGGPVAVAVFHDTVVGTVKHSTYNPATNSFSALVTEVASGVTAVDAAPYEDDPSGGWLVLYNVGTTVRMAYWRLSGQQTTVDQPITAMHSLDRGMYVCGRYGQSVWAVWRTTLAFDCFYRAQRRVADTSFAASTASVIFQTLNTSDTRYVVTGITHLGTDKIFASYRFSLYEFGTNLGTFRSAWQVLEHDSGLINSLAFGQIPFGLIATTRPFVVGGEVYQPFVYNLNYTLVSTLNPTYQCKQSTLYLCKFFGVSDDMGTLGTILPNKCFPVATVAPRQVSTAYQYWDTASGHVGLPSTVLRSTTRCAVGLYTKGVTDASSQDSGPAWASDFFWGSEGLYQTSEIGSVLSIASGVPFVSDGSNTFEDGFFNYPEFARVELQGTGNSLESGDYAFAVVYRHVDAAGLIHRSAPYVLPPITVTLGGGYPVLEILAPMGSYRDFKATDDSKGQVAAEIFSTLPNGGTLYFHGVKTLSNIFGVMPDPWNSGVTYTVTDVPNAGAPLLYTTGGVLDHVNPPASSSQIVHQQRKALVDETRRGVWMSKNFSPGQAPGFNEALYQDFPEGGDITALGSMDSRLIAFKSDSIWFVEGQGPSPNGLGSNWSSPAAVPTDIGCKSWQSVITMPNGLMFQSQDNGLYLLGRDLTVVFVGKGVSDTTEAYPNIVSATLVSEHNHVRFLCLNAARDEHVVVVYDYLLDAWATHRYDHLSGTPAAVCMSSDSVARYTVLSADGNLWQERLSTDPERHLDQDAEGFVFFVPTVVKVPFVKLQVQGYHRARRVQFFGERQDDCGFQVHFAFNYEDAVRQTCTWSAGQLRSLRTKGQVEAYVSAAYNKGMSIQATFSDTEGENMTTGAGMRFVSSAFEIQNLGPRYRLLSAGARR